LSDFESLSLDLDLSDLESLSFDLDLSDLASLSFDFDDFTDLSGVLDFYLSKSFLLDFLTFASLSDLPSRDLLLDDLSSPLLVFFIFEFILLQVLIQI
jgi:hypothetical protein